MRRAEFTVSFTRRQALLASAALGAHGAFAAVAPPRARRTVYVVARGGWDATRVLSDGFDSPTVHMEPGSVRASVNGFTFVDHPDRPNVRAFFGEHASRSIILQGLRMPSIDHRVGSRLLGSLTHHTPTFLAGPAHPGGVAAAVAALAAGPLPSVTLFADDGTPTWDTHADNDAQQSPQWECLFARLSELQSRLAGTLAEEPVVVVLSELGRTPTLNRAGGKDHWPYTSALLVGGGLCGGRTLGGWDRYGYGRTLDFDSGALAERGQPLRAENLVATLRVLSGADPAPDVPPIGLLLA